jgi:serine/threonine protein kinase
LRWPIAGAGGGVAVLLMAVITVLTKKKRAQGSGAADGQLKHLLHPDSAAANDGHGGHDGPVTAKQIAHFQVSPSDLTLRHEIGRGSSGVVYECLYRKHEIGKEGEYRTTSEGTTVAVKCFGPSCCGMCCALVYVLCACLCMCSAHHCRSSGADFEKEMLEMASCYTRNNLVQMIGFCTGVSAASTSVASIGSVGAAASSSSSRADGIKRPPAPFIVMKRYERNLAEHLRSGELKKHCNSSKTYFHRLQMVLWDVAQGMSVLHCSFPKVKLHRDLKLHNIFIDSDGRAHVGDLGLAKVKIAPLGATYRRLQRTA